MSQDPTNFIDLEDNNLYGYLQSSPKLETGYHNSLGNFEDVFFEEPLHQNQGSFNLERLNCDVFTQNFLNSEANFQFQSVSEKKEECSSEQSNPALSSHAIPDPISSKSRRIMKRERAKQRNQAKKSDLTEDAILAGDIPQRYIPEGFHQPDLDEKTKKKMIQTMKNRIAAQNSRDRKKQLIEQLENHKRILADENLKLKGKVRELEEENFGLQKKTQEYEQILENIYSFTSDQEDLLSKEFSVDSDNLQNSNQSVDISKTKSNLTPKDRKASRSVSLMGYTFTLATIFAVLMFNDINSSINEMFTPTMVPDTPQKTHFKAPAPKRAPSANNSRSLVMVLEEKVSSKLSKISNYWNEFPLLKHLSSLNRSFNEKYMSSFFSELKITDQIDLIDKPELRNTSTATSHCNPAQFDFATYLRSSKKQFSDILERKDTSQNQLATLVSGNDSLPNLKNESFSSLFCPSGYAFQQQDSVKIEEEETTGPSRKKLKLIDSEWLQLFVPKSRVYTTKIMGQNEVSINTPQEDRKEDNSILEVWSKVFFVRELRSSF